MRRTLLIPGGNQRSASLVLAVLLLTFVFGASGAAATTIDFSLQPTSTPPSFSSSGVTITGSADLDFLAGRGLGVAGGFYHPSLGPVLDQGESLFFDFDAGSAANGVQIYVDLLYNPNGTALSGLNVTGYDVNGDVISTVAQSVGGSGWIGISNLFGPGLTGFDLVAPNDGIQFSQLEYDLVPVPAPAAIWLVGPGLLGLACHGRRRYAA